MAEEREDVCKDCETWTYSEYRQGGCPSCRPDNDHFRCGICKCILPANWITNVCYGCG